MLPNETTLEDEYLINTIINWKLLKNILMQVLRKPIYTYHPTNPNCAGLMLKKDTDLRKIIEKNEIPCTDKTRNAVMRSAIWEFYKDDLQLEEIEIDVSKGDKKIFGINCKRIYHCIHYFKRIERIVMEIMKYRIL